ncbi:hypothetical protein MRX96_014711 [Rhipicephalus microplus]
MLRMRSLPLATGDALGSVFVHQTVYVFPPAGQPFDPNCVRLVTRGRDPATAVACMLGFFKLVCEDGYKQMVRASEVDGVWLNDVHVSGVFVRRELRSLCADSEPAATMDDFYVLLGVLLCNLPRARGSNLNRDWFQNRINDLVELFPGVSEPPSRAPLWRGAGGRHLQLRREVAPHQGGPLPRPAQEPLRGACSTLQYTRL